MVGGLPGGRGLEAEVGGGEAQPMLKGEWVGAAGAEPHRTCWSHQGRVSLF